MEQNNVRKHISALLITLILAACSPAVPVVPPEAPQSTQAVQATATTPPLESTPAREGGTPSAEQGLCSNLYYPARQGATWTYKSSGGPAGEYSFTDTVTAVRPDGFTLTTQIGELRRAQEWTCAPEGLTALQFGGAPAAMLNSQNIQLSLDVTNASGVAFPAQIDPGDRWQQTLDVQGNVSVMNEEGEASGRAEMDFSAVGLEQVTVPAGTFEAMKVEVAVTLGVNVSYEGMTLPVSVSGDYTYWFAPGVGWVKSSGSGSMLGTSFSETTELQSYSMP